MDVIFYRLNLNEAQENTSKKNNKRKEPQISHQQHDQQTKIKLHKFSKAIQKLEGLSQDSIISNLSNEVKI